jgi:hypothetical protein
MELPTFPESPGIKGPEVSPHAIPKIAQFNEVPVTMGAVDFNYQEPNLWMELTQGVMEAVNQWQTLDYQRMQLRMEETEMEYKDALDFFGAKVDSETTGMTGYQSENSFPFLPTRQIRIPHFDQAMTKEEYDRLTKLNLNLTGGIF